MHYSPAQPSPARVFLQAAGMVTHSGISSKTMSIQVSTAEEYMPNFRSLWKLFLTPNTKYSRKSIRKYLVVVTEDNNHS